MASITDRSRTLALDLIHGTCRANVTLAGRAEFARRARRAPVALPNDREVMRRICVAISYSQGARAAQVEKLLKAPAFSEAFVNFDPTLLADCDPDGILGRHWPALGHIRFKGKVRCIVQCARVLNGIIRDCGSFALYLRRFKIPRRISTEAMLDQFWRGFDALQQDLRHRQMPFFRSTTSLLQLLLDFDYDSVKPDLIIMRLAWRVGIVERKTGDPAFRQCVRFLQAYSVIKACRAAELDLALLAFGGQTGARQLLSHTFCPPSGGCHHRTCSLGVRHLCKDHKSTDASAP